MLKLAAFGSVRAYGKVSGKVSVRAYVQNMFPFPDFLGKRPVQHHWRNRIIGVITRAYDVYGFMPPQRVLLGSLGLSPRPVA